MTNYREKRTTASKFCENGSSMLAYTRFGKAQRAIEKWERTVIEKVQKGYLRYLFTFNYLWCFIAADAWSRRTKSRSLRSTFFYRKYMILVWMHVQFYEPVAAWEIENDAVHKKRAWMKPTFAHMKLIYFLN